MKLSDAQWRALRLISRGQSPSVGLVGMSEMGGLAATMASLRRRKLIDENNAVTSLGATALEEEKRKVQP